MQASPNAPLPLDILSPGKLREHFSRYQPPARPVREGLKAAAVLVPLVLRPEGMTVLLTQRTDHLRDHAGQVSFPGGRYEAADGNLVTTALREAEEEVGLILAQIEVIGTLPDYDTGTGFVVSPVVGLVTPPFDLKLDTFEVADVFEPPLAFLMNPSNHQRHRYESPQKKRQFWAMPWQGHYIWGATAGMIVSLYQSLSGA